MLFSMNELRKKGRIRIREAGPADTSLVLALIREIAEYEKLSHEVVATEEMIRRSLFGDGAFVKALIAEADGETAGYILYFNNFSTFVGRPGIYIEDIFIRPAFRSAGVGRALVQRVAAIAKREGWGRIEFAVLDWNPARRFYEKLGAKHLADWLFYRIAGEDLDRLAAQAGEDDDGDR
jgi:GNAT superfamily N-acetyltransferase